MCQNTGTRSKGQLRTQILTFLKSSWRAVIPRNNRTITIWRQIVIANFLIPDLNHSYKLLFFFSRWANWPTSEWVVECNCKQAHSTQQHSIQNTEHHTTAHSTAHSIQHTAEREKEHKTPTRQHTQLLLACVGLLIPFTNIHHRCWWSGIWITLCYFKCTSRRYQLCLCLV